MEALVKRFLRSLIKKHLKPYLLYELTTDQLSQVEGGFQLSGLELNPKALDTFLPPFLRVTSGSLSISIDLASLMDGQLRICLSDVDIVINRVSEDESNIIGDNSNTDPFNNEFSSSENPIYGLDGVKAFVGNVEKMLNEVEVSITNLSVELHTSEFGERCYIVTHFPKLNMTHIDSDKNSFSKAFTLPDDFTVSLHELEPGASSGMKTLLFRGASFFGSDNLSPTTIKAIISEQANSKHIRLEILLRSLQGALDPRTFEILSQLYKLFTIGDLGQLKDHFEETIDDMDGFDSVDEDENFHDIEDTVFGVKYGDNASNFNSSDDEFKDCFETMIEGTNNDIDNDDDDDNNEEIVLTSFLQEPEKPKKNHIVTYDITFTIKQATLTLVHESNPAALATVFSKPFDANKLTAPPYTNYDHTTFYIADLEASLAQLSSSTNCSLKINTCGATQFLYNDPNIPEYYSTLQVLNISLRDTTEIVPILCTFKMEKKFPNLPTVSCDTKVILSEMSIVIDDSLYHRLLPFITIGSSFLQPSSSENSDINDNNNNNINYELSTKTEAEDELLSSKNTFQLSAKSVSLRANLSTEDNYSLQLDLEGLDINSSIASNAIIREWDITLSKIVGSLIRNGNITPIFSAAEFRIAKDDAHPVNPSINIQTTEYSKLSKNINNLDNSSIKKSEINMMENYDMDNQDTGFTIENDDNPDTIPYPLDYNRTKRFEDKAKNPTVAPDLDNFFLKANNDADTKIVIRLPNSNIDLAKEDYDLLQSFINEFMKNISKNNNSIEKDNNNLKKSSSKISNNEDENISGSIVCEISILKGSFVLREKVALSESNEEEVLSSFHGSFQDCSVFFVSNYAKSGESYFHTCIESIELRDCAPHHIKPLQLIQKPKYSIVHCARMFSIVGKMSKDENLIVLSLSDISIQYNLGGDWTTRLSDFFTPEITSISTFDDDDKSKNNLSSSKSKSDILYYLNLHNITVDYLPYKALSASVFLLKEAQAQYITQKDGGKLELRLKPYIYFIDNVHKIVSLSDNETEKLERHEYLEALGFRSVGGMHFCPIVIEFSKLNNGKSFTHITLENNDVDLHLCKDSYSVLLQLYGDYAMFSDKSIDPTSPTTEAANSQFDDSAFVDTEENTNFNFTIHTLEDYTPTNNNNESSLSDNNNNELLLSSSSSNIKTEEMIQTIIDEEEKNIDKPKLNSFDNEFDDEFDNLPLDSDNNAFAFDISDQSSISKDKEYMVIGVDNIDDIPSNAIPFANQLSFSTDSDDLFVDDDDYDSYPILTTPSFNSSNSMDELESEFDLLNITEEKQPIVRIRSDLIERLQKTKKENNNDIKKLPPMLGIPISTNYTSKRKIENLLDLPDSYPDPSIKISLIEWNVNITIHDGLHWTPNRENTQSEKNKIIISLKKLTVQLYLFNNNEKYSMRMGMSITDIDILDKIEVSSCDTLLCYDTHHLRTTNSSMISVLLVQQTPIENNPARSELKVKLLPIRVKVDQDARYFVTEFFSAKLPELPKSSVLWDLHFSKINLHLDYKAKRFDGDYLNLVSLHGAKFSLDGIEEICVVDIAEILKQYTELTLELVRSFILGLGPLTPIVNLGKGISSLFYQPYSQYKKNGRILRGLQKGVYDFGGSLASETLNLGSKVASGSQMILEYTDECLNTLRPDSLKTKSGSSFNHPKSCQQGFSEGFNSIKREGETAYKHLFVIPMEEYKEKGTSGCVNALAHALPIAVLRPMIGIAEGAKHVGVGAKNQIASKNVTPIYKNS